MDKYEIPVQDKVIQVRRYKTGIKKEDQHPLYSHIIEDKYENKLLQIQGRFDVLGKIEAIYKDFKGMPPQLLKEVIQQKLQIAKDLKGLSNYNIPTLDVLAKFGADMLRYKILSAEDYLEDRRNNKRGMISTGTDPDQVIDLVDEDEILNRRSGMSPSMDVSSYGGSARPIFELDDDDIQNIQSFARSSVSEEIKQQPSQQLDLDVQSNRSEQQQPRRVVRDPLERLMQSSEESKQRVEVQQNFQQAFNEAFPSDQQHTLADKYQWVLNYKTSGIQDEAFRKNMENLLERAISSDFNDAIQGFQGDKAAKYLFLMRSLKDPQYQAVSKQIKQSSIQTSFDIVNDLYREGLKQDEMRRAFKFLGIPEDVVGDSQNDTKNKIKKYIDEL